LETAGGDIEGQLPNASATLTLSISRSLVVPFDAGDQRVDPRLQSNLVALEGREWQLGLQLPLEIALGLTKSNVTDTPLAGGDQDAPQRTLTNRETDGSLRAGSSLDIPLRHALPSSSATDTVSRQYRSSDADYWPLSDLTSGASNRATPPAECRRIDLPLQLAGLHGLG
jgi:hypothetical protein